MGLQRLFLPRWKSRWAADGVALGLSDGLEGLMVGVEVEFVGFLLEAMALPSSDLGPVESLEAARAAAALRANSDCSGVSPDLLNGQG